MLFEKTTYQNDFPINIRIVNVEEYPFHYHQDVEFIYVLKGELLLKNVCHYYHLKEGDVFTNSGNEVHAITSSGKDNIVAIIQVSNRFFTQYFPDLQKACFMSYVKEDKYHRLDPLRKMLLKILLDYTKRNFDYKSTCVDQMVEALKYLNCHYNLFAFEGKVVVGFNNDDPIVVERISRIINYVYENHSSKITLEDIAEREHLSTFYLSHLIRDNMGISFQEFLCFARAEKSEILLLETDHKVSTISKESGFSTTAYYTKSFSRWFGHIPDEYRELNSGHILSSRNPAQYKLLSENQAITIIQKCMSAENDQTNSSSIVNQLHLNVEVCPDISPIMNINHALEIAITIEDYKIMHSHIFDVLNDLGASSVVLAFHRDEDKYNTTQMEHTLSAMGISIAKVCDNDLSIKSAAGCDTIAAPINLFLNNFATDTTTLHCRLRDQGEPSKIIQGAYSCITSCLIPKPLYYACKMLKNISGELLYWGKYYFVIKNDSSTRDSYTFVIINYNDDIKKLNTRTSSVYETDDIVSSYKDELSIDFKVPVNSGQYIIAKYELSNSNSIFAHMSRLEFPEVFPLSEKWLHMLDTSPQSEISIKHVVDQLIVSSSLKGAGIQVIVAEKSEG